MMERWNTGILGLIGILSKYFGLAPAKYMSRLCVCAPGYLDNQTRNTVRLKIL